MKKTILSALLALLSSFSSHATEAITVNGTGDANPGWLLNDPTLFNGANMAIKLDGTGKIPALNGSLITNISAASVPFSGVTGTLTSAQFAALISNETGTGLLAFATSPTFTTPVINGTPSGTAFGTGVATALGNAANAASGFITSNSSGYSAPNVLTTNSGFLLTGFTGPFLTGRERAWLACSQDGLIWQQIHGLENFVPPPFTVGITATGASPDVFTVAASTVLHVGATVTQSGFANTNLNGKFTIATLPTGTTYTLYTYGTTTPVNGSGSAETGGTLSLAHGIRDTYLIKSGNQYLMSYTPSLSGNSYESFMGIAGSLDLVNWYHIAFTTTTAIVAPHWLQDTDGTTWLLSYNKLKQNTSTTGGFADGVSWGSDVSITFSDGTISNAVDQMLVQKGGLYYFFFIPSTDPTNYYVASSSSRASGYTNLGKITNWGGVVVEGVSITLDNAGVYHSWARGPGNGNVHSTSTTLLPGSWTTPVALTNNPTTPNFNPMLSLDGGGGIAINNVDLLRDTTSALSQWSSWQSVQAGSPHNLYSNVPVGINSGGQARITGTGTVSTSSTTVTGTGTLFLEELQIGSSITGASGGDAWVTAIASNTSMTVAAISGSPSGTFTYCPPPLSIIPGPLSQTYPQFTVCGPTGAVNYPLTLLGGADLLFGNLKLKSNAGYLRMGNTVGFAAQAAPFQLILDQGYGSNTPGALANLKLVLLDGADYGVGVSNNLLEFQTPVAMSWFKNTALEMNLDTNGNLALSLGNFTFSTAGKGIVGGTTATYPSSGNVGYSPLVSVAPGSAVALTTATSANMCSQAVPAGHYLVSVQATFAATGATMVLSSPMQAGINTTSATLPTASAVGNLGIAITAANATNTVPLGTQEVTLTSSGTIYAVCNATFTLGSVAVYGQMQIVQLP